MKERTELEQWFNETFVNLEQDKDVLMGELENAKKEFPRLIVAYQLLEIYARFLYRKSKAMTRGLSSYTPIPNGGGGIFPFPPIIKKKDILQELEKWAAAQIEVGAQWEAANREEIRTCDDITRELARASECVQGYVAQLPQSDEAWDEFHQCISDLEELASEAEANGCE